MEVTFTLDFASTRSKLIVEIKNKRVQFPDISVVKNLPTDAGDAGLIPGSGRSPGEGNENPLQ